MSRFVPATASSYAAGFSWYFLRTLPKPVVGNFADVHCPQVQRAAGNHLRPFLFPAAGGLSAKRC